MDLHDADPCYNCVFWLEEPAIPGFTCPVRRFETLNELKNTVMCKLGEEKDDGEFASVLVINMDMDDFQKRLYGE